MMVLLLKSILQSTLPEAHMSAKETEWPHNPFCQSCLVQETPSTHRGLRQPLQIFGEYS